MLTGPMQGSPIEFFSTLSPPLSNAATISLWSRSQLLTAWGWYMGEASIAVLKNVVRTHLIQTVLLDWRVDCDWEGEMREGLSAPTSQAGRFYLLAVLWVR